MSIRTPTIIVTGLRRAGLNLLADMLRAGFIPDSRIIVARDPQDNAPPILPTSTCLGLFVDRTSNQIIASLNRDNANEQRAPLSYIEARIIKRRLVRDLRRARDAAARQFAPLHVFEFERLIDDPLVQAARLDLIVRDAYPMFSARAASLGVRRIHHTRNTQPLKGSFRVIKS